MQIFKNLYIVWLVSCLRTFYGGTVPRPLATLLIDNHSF